MLHEHANGKSNHTPTQYEVLCLTPLQQWGQLCGLWLGSSSWSAQSYWRVSTVCGEWRRYGVASATWVCWPQVGALGQGSGTWAVQGASFVTSYDSHFQRLTWLIHSSSHDCSWNLWHRDQVKQHRQLPYLCYMCVFRAGEPSLCAMSSCPCSCFMRCEEMASVFEIHQLAAPAHMKR